MTIGERIKDSRMQKGIKQKELAEKAEISVNALINYEKNKRNPPLGVIDKIALALDIEPFELVYGNESPIKDFEILKNYIANTKKQAETHNQQIQAILKTLDRHNIKYKVLERSKTLDIPLDCKISMNNTDLILSTDDLIEVYDKAEASALSSFDTAVINSIDIIGTYKKQGD